MDAPKTPGDKPTSWGVFDRPRQAGVSGIEISAVVLSAIWLVGSAAFFLTRPDEGYEGAAQDPGLMFMLTMMAIFLPVAMIWVAATAARSTRVMREESQRLQTAIDAIRQSYLAQQQGRERTQGPSVARKLDEIAAVTRKTENALATFSTSRDPARPAASAPPQAALAEDQTTLALGTPVEETAPPLPNADFIRALNFPETAEDEAGFAALRRALRDRPTAQIVQAAQDVLTLLSQDGIYMDDLQPDRARAEVWRAFAHGARGRSIAALGSVRDRTSLALTAGRMKQDPIFRDAVHHFLRRFDRSIAAFEPQATDAEMAALGDTRTARAFMLLGRVAGTFD